MHIGALIEKQCTACTACVNICTDQAINMRKNLEGFFEACVDDTKCSDCGKCIEVCQLVQEGFILKNGEPLYYAAFSKDLDNVQNSSSGGVFYELAKSILKGMGIVYGAVQESIFGVRHQRADNLEQVALFRRSKYLESDLNDCFNNIKKDLENGKQVLFSGVGCQIAGLYYFLQKEYENLYTCEVVCHGIPSYLAFEKYLQEKNVEYGKKICGINFRDKSFGWKDNAICEQFEGGERDVLYSSRHPLHSIYLKGINMRSGCGTCKYAQIPRVADITLADFWQYEGKLAEINQNRGLSLIAVNNEKGDRLLSRISDQIYLDKVDKETALKSCRHMNNSPILHENQKIFMQMLLYRSFHFASEICSMFGPVIEEAKLYKMTGIDEEYIWDVFWKDEQEIVYVLNEDKKLEGIVTYGSFMRNYREKNQWVNYDFQKVVISENSASEIRDIFDSNLKINRVPVIDQENFLMFEVRRNDVKIIPYVIDNKFLEIGQIYENLFEKRKLVFINEREQWREETISSSLFIVDTICKKNILRLKYDVESVYAEEYLGEMKLMEPFIGLLYQGIEVYYIKRPDCLSDHSYSQEERARIEREDSFPKLSEDIKKNEKFLKEIFKEKFSYKYINGLRKIPQIVEKNGRYQHVDQISEYVNVFGGHRKTVCQPEEYKASIHIYGRCGVFGYAVEDSDTMPSLLQKIFIGAGQKIRIINHGLWGADNEKILHNLSIDIIEGVIGKEDKVVIYMDYLPYMEQLESLGICIKDTTYSFHKFAKNKKIFYDKPGHMTAEGYKYIANYIYQTLEHPSSVEINEEKEENMQKLLFLFQEKQKAINKSELEKYLCRIEKEISDKLDLKKKTGAIVMNCNPFTNGHRYLIETAAREVGNLLIFVLEEDRSFFSFEDRFKMVKEGTKDLKNVYVLPSGKFMISALTFPEYFIKEQEENIKINPIMDVQMFAIDIAPRLHITMRFAGTEPKDKVTKQYNDMLREHLPLYGIKFEEIDRLEQDGRIVTATDVRKMIIQREKEKLKDFVPESTYNYLREEGFLEVRKI